MFYPIRVGEIIIKYVCVRVVYMYMFTCVSVNNKYLCTCVCMCACMYVRIQCMRVYLKVCMHVCMCMIDTYVDPSKTSRYMNQTYLCLLTNHAHEAYATTQLCESMQHRASIAHEKAAWNVHWAPCCQQGEALTVSSCRYVPYN